MGCRNRDLATLRRLENKTLDATFAKEAQQGLGCSRFEAHALVDLVREIYQPSADADNRARHRAASASWRPMPTKAPANRFANAANAAFV